MNAWSWSAGALVVGILAGIGATWWEFQGEETPTLTAGEGGGPSLVLSDETSRGSGKVEIVNGEKFDFGTMQRGETRSHTFKVKNVGLAPLTLTPGPTTCQCTLAKISQSVLEAGQEAELTLEWTPKTYSESFSQGLDLKTTDPDRQVVPISISGRVVQAARPVPDELNVGRLTASAPAQYTVMVFCYNSSEFAITKIEYEHPETAEYYECRTESVTDSQMLALQGAKSAVKVSVTVKPGLPLGPIHQTIRLVTSLKEIAPLELPIRGTAVSDVSFLAGKNFDPEHNMLTLDAVSAEKGAKVVIHVAVKGEGATDVQVKVKETFPASILKAELGEPKVSQNGGQVLRTLTVSIPPGSPPATHYGSDTGKLGRVELETTHPSAKKITLYVHFAVE